ncbi:hypothetical protein BDV98DRAFT_608311, partial [Pterulicium gracile]
MESQQQKGRSRARKRDWLGNIFRPSRGPSPVRLSDVPPSAHPVTTDGSSGDTLAIPVQPANAWAYTADLCLGDSRTSTGVPIRPSRGSDLTAVTPLPGSPQNSPFVCQAPSENSMSGEDTPVIGVHLDASFSRMSTGGGHIGSFNNTTGTLIYNAGPGLKAAPAPRCPAASLNFVGREEEQKIIWNFYFGPEVQLDERRIFSIVGMGGCGKTQLTRKFMKRVYERFSKKNESRLVFYVDGTTQATIEASLVSIAKANGLEESSEAALAWMSNLDTEFFMYIDNADDPTINMRGFFSN